MKSVRRAHEPNGSALPATSAPDRSAIGPMVTPGVTRLLAALGGLVLVCLVLVGCSRTDDPRRLRITDGNAATWFKDVKATQRLTVAESDLLDAAIMRAAEGGVADPFRAAIGKTVGEIIDGERREPVPFKIPTARPQVATVVAGSPPSDDAQRAYLPKVELRHLEARPGLPELGQGIAIVKFEVKNGGDRTLDDVVVMVYFLDKAGQRVHEDAVHPVLVGGYGVENTPLRPNYTRTYGGGIRDIPSDWAGKITATVTAVAFSK
jgi:hypothetical protein